MSVTLKPVILIIDDSPDIINLISGLLRNYYKVKSAINGEKGLAIAQSDNSIDLILLDLMMPGLSGFEVCKRLKENPITAHIPIIFLTALSDVEDEQFGLELGAVDYISKPISPAILMARVKNHLRIKAANDLLKDKNLQAHLRLDLILNATGEGIYGIGINGDCIFMNASALTMLGYESQQEVLGKNNHQLFHYAHANGSVYNAELCPIYNALQGHSNSSDEAEVFWRKDGTSFPVQYEAHPIKNNEEIIGCVVSFIDITERKQNEALLLAAKERAENLSKTKSQFLANMSHEIRTPMSAIIGFSELALLYDMPQKVSDYLKNINTASNNLMVILNDILDLSKLEAGKMGLNLSPFNVHDLQKTLYNLFIDTAQSKGLALKIDIDERVPEHLIYDPFRLRQVLTNLLGNAIKFTQQGSVSLNISLLELDELQARLLFAVTDTGIGIAEDQQDKLFMPFSQVDDGYARKFEGTGLGLVISQDLVALMKSQIKVDSQPGEGSCFSFELLLPTTPTSELTSIKTPSTNSATIDTRSETEALIGFKILVVEDDSFNQKIIHQVLKRHGASLIVLTNDGSEALSALEQQDFDVVLMDLHMPVMNGYQATTEIRKNPHYAKLPVIALSASVTDEERQRSLAAGMNDFVGKPINVNELLSTLVQWLNR
ncbi:MAG: response regulator [Methylococcales bacterium]